MSILHIHSEPGVHGGEPFIHPRTRVIDVLDRIDAGDEITEVAEDFGCDSLDLSMLIELRAALKPSEGSGAPLPEAVVRPGDAVSGNLGAPQPLPEAWPSFVVQRFEQDDPIRPYRYVVLDGTQNTDFSNCHLYAPDAQPLPEGEKCERCGAEIDPEVDICRCGADLNDLGKKSPPEAPRCGGGGYVEEERAEGTVISTPCCGCPDCNPQEVEAASTDGLTDDDRARLEAEIAHFRDLAQGERRESERAEDFSPDEGRFHARATVYEYVVERLRKLAEQPSTTTDEDPEGKSCSTSGTFLQTKPHAER